MPTNLIKRSTLFSFIFAIGGGGPTQGSIRHRIKANRKKNFMKRILIKILNGLAAS